jgi:hypothetical protein
MPIEFYLKKIYDYSKINEIFGKVEEEERENFANEEAFLNEEFKEKMIKEYLSKRDSNNDQNITVELLDLKEILFMRKLFYIWKMYNNEEKPKFKEIINEFENQAKEEDIDWTQYLDLNKYDKLGFLIMLIKTKTFDHGKGGFIFLFFVIFWKF